MSDDRFDEMLKILTGIRADLTAIRCQLQAMDCSLANLERMARERPL